MRKENFEEILTMYKVLSDKLVELYDVGIDLYESRYAIADELDIFKNLAFKGNYNQAGVDLINWFIYDNQWGKRDWSMYENFTEGIEDIIEAPRKYGMTDENGNPVCYDIESLWNYLEKNCK